MDPDLGRLLLEASRQVGADLVAELQERGFDDARPAHAVVVLRVDRRAGTRMGDLATRAGMTKQGMMLLVDDLENRGYVRRVPDPEDARARVVRLTARGRRYVAEFRRALAAVEGRVRRDLGDGRFDAMRAALEDLVSASPDAEADERGDGSDGSSDDAEV